MADDGKKEVCGLVMPLSSIDDLSETHWLEVRSILSEAIINAGFEPNLVSDADDIGIIQKRIIQNLYDNPIAVVDVSAKNPNVMFELGLRLAFDKPTIIVKDDKTAYAFDTAPIEHLPYPRDLRYAQINEFKTKLTEKIKGTHSKATSDPDYTTFLKHFGEFTVAKLDKKEVSGQEFILEELKALRQSIHGLQTARVPFGKQMLDNDPTKTVGRPIISIRGIDSKAARDSLNDILLNAELLSGWKREADGGATLLLRPNLTSEEVQHLMDLLRARGFTNILLAG
jgi:hypothetical protein